MGFATCFNSRGYSADGADLDLPIRVSSQAYDMLFNSYSFLLFFLGVLALHALPLPWRVRKFNLLWASYLFYAAWNPPFVVLLWISTLADWFIARWMHRAESRSRRRLLLAASLVVNLGLLGFFKYRDFVLENFVLFIEPFGLTFEPARLSIVLPVGISFYTFQTLSYTFDVYRKHMKPWPSLLDFAMYVTFFPQLVAGPIVRASDFQPQCKAPRKVDSRHLGWGLLLFLIGLFNKQVIADLTMAPIVESVFDSGTVPGCLSAWAGTCAFAIQIFCDFAGYSACAIGIAVALGFYLPDNFRFPYAALGFSDFWSRWHISLSTWLRDYLYVPMGGSRKGTIRTGFSLMLTMLIGGLWHGASWLFVLWGGLHGVFLVVERALRLSPLGKRGVWQTRGGHIVIALATFACVCIGWVFFRASSLEIAFAMLRSMFSAGGGAPIPKQEIIAAFGVTAAVLGVHAFMRNRSLESVVEKLPRWFRVVAIGVMFYAVACSFSAEDRAFIYFKF